MTEETDYFAANLSAEEAYQIMIASADDIDVPGMEKDPEALAAQRYPSNEGWDLHFGYGRNNVGGSLEMIRDMKIPPEANISGPRWFETIDPNRRTAVDVVGTVSSPRLSNLTWTLSTAAVRTCPGPVRARCWFWVPCFLPRLLSLVHI